MTDDAPTTITTTPPFGSALSTQATTRDIVNAAVNVRALQDALTLAYDALRDQLAERAHKHRKVEGTKWRAPVPGIGQATLPEGDPRLVVVDHERLASWLAEHEPDAAAQCVHVAYNVHVTEPRQAYNALQRLADVDSGDEHDEDCHLVLHEAANDLLDAVTTSTSRTVDLDALGVHFPARAPDGRIITMDNELVPHVVVEQPRPGVITVTPNKAHRERLTRAYAARMGLPEELTA